MVMKEPASLSHSRTSGAFVSNQVASRLAKLLQSSPLPASATDLPALHKFTAQHTGWLHSFASSYLPPSLAATPSVGNTALTLSFEQLVHLSRDVESLVSTLDHSLRSLMTEFASACRDGHALVDTSQCHVFLDDLVQLIISSRTLLAHHNMAVKAFQRQEYTDEMLEPAQVRLMSDALLVVENALERARSICAEKYTIAPPIDIVSIPDSNKPLSLLSVEPYLAFCVTEAAKNALQAAMDRFGPLDVDEVPHAVLATVSHGPASDGRSGGEIVIAIHDKGTGIKQDALPRMFDYLYTGHPRLVQERFTGYGYSRDFGDPFTGLGVGLPLSRQYARFLGGSLDVLPTSRLDPSDSRLHSRYLHHHLHHLRSQKIDTSEFATSAVLRILRSAA